MSLAEESKYIVLARDPDVPSNLWVDKIGTKEEIEEYLQEADLQSIFEIFEFKEGCGGASYIFNIVCEGEHFRWAIGKCRNPQSRHYNKEVCANDKLEDCTVNQRCGKCPYFLKLD